MSDSKRKVLIIDDSASSVKLIETVCKTREIESVLFTNPKEAYHYWLGHIDEIGVVISDIDMPEMSGVDLFWMMLEWDSSIRFVFMSGDVGGDSGERHDLLESLYNHPNVVAVFKKPFVSVVDLGETLDSELDS